MSGMPVVSVDAKTAEDPRSLSDVVDMVGKLAAGENVFVVLDEFQEIRKIAGADQILAILRSRIQLLADTCFVFSGSVRDDIAEARLEKAKRLLAETKTPVGEIPGLVGFESPLHFARFFKTRTGMSMRDWRRRQ